MIKRIRVAKNGKKRWKIHLLKKFSKEDISRAEAVRIRGKVLTIARAKNTVEITKVYPKGSKTKSVNVELITRIKTPEGVELRGQNSLIGFLYGGLFKTQYGQIQISTSTINPEINQEKINKFHDILVDKVMNSWNGWFMDMPDDEFMVGFVNEILTKDEAKEHIKALITKEQDWKNINFIITAFKNGAIYRIAYGDVVNDRIIQTLGDKCFNGAFCI
ncbi:MAG: hypothetical protein ACE5ES_01800 [Candidatus Nanoarchaeia archaeon]